MNLKPMWARAVGARSTMTSFWWLAGDRFGRVALGVVVSIAVARHLGPEQFGSLSFAVALTGIVAVVAALGLDDIVVREMSGPTGSSRIWWAAFRLRCWAVPSGYLAIVAFAWFWRGTGPDSLGIVAIVAAGLFFSPADLVEAWFIGKGNPRPAAVTRHAATWIAAVWRLTLVWQDASVWAFALAVIVEAILVAGAFFVIFRPFRATGNVMIHSRELSVRLLKEGWPLMASGTLVTLTMQVDRLMLGRLAGDTAVGIYVVATRLTELFHLVPVAAGAAIMPKLSAAYRSDAASYRRISRNMVLALLIAGVVSTAAISFAGPWGVLVVFGNDYVEAGRVLVVHGWSLIFVFLVSLRTRLLVIEGGTRWVLVMSLITAICSVVGNALLIPSFGVSGAAWAAVMAWAISALVAPWFFGPTRQMMINLLRVPKGGRALG